MKKIRLVIFLFSALFLFYCVSRDAHISGNSTYTTKSTDSVNVEKKSDQKPMDTTNDGYNCLTNEQIMNSITRKEFVSRMCDEYYLSYDYSIKNLEIIEREIVPNTHDTTINDTIITFSNGVDKSVFYKTAFSSILLFAVINSQNIKLDKDIQIGMSKDMFEHKLKLMKVSDFVVISHLEGCNVFAFYFRDNKLFRIRYETTYLG